jgi:hypothetical protein
LNRLTDRVSNIGMPHLAGRRRRPGGSACAGVGGGQAKLISQVEVTGNGFE